MSPVGENWSIYPFIGIGRYNAIETTDVPDTALNEITGLLGSDVERFTTQTVSSLSIPFGVKLYRSKKKFAGFYVGANGFYSFNGSYGLFGNVGLAFGGRKRVPLEQPLIIKPDFALYTGPGWMGNKSVFGLNHGVDVHFFIRENVFVGFGGEWMNAMNESEQLAIIHNPVGGKSGNIKLGVKTAISDKMSVLISSGLTIQSLTKTTNQRVESTLVDEVIQGVGGVLGIPTEEKVEYTTENVTNAGFLFEALFRRQFGDSPFSLMFGPRFSVSKESTYNLKLGISYSIM